MDTTNYLQLKRKKMKEKMCAYPNCGRIASSRGMNSITRKSKRFKWCRYHRTGDGVKEKQSYLEIKKYTNPKKK